METDCNLPIYHKLSQRKFVTYSTTETHPIPSPASSQINNLFFCFFHYYYLKSKKKRNRFQSVLQQIKKPHHLSHSPTFIFFFTFYLNIFIYFLNSLQTVETSWIDLAVRLRTRIANPFSLTNNEKSPMIFFCFVSFFLLCVDTISCSMSIEFYVVFNSRVCVCV